jgi:nicotinate phosphoribosyltransferase
MSIFNGKRLTNSTFKLDIERMRQGWYSDKYFVNIAQTLQALAEIDYRYTGHSPILGQLGIDPASLATGDIEVEMQIFTRRQPRALIAGVDKALSMLRHCTGYYNIYGQFIETWARLRVEAPVRDSLPDLGEAFEWTPGTGMKQHGPSGSRD